LRQRELGEPSTSMRERVVTARDIQRERFGVGKTRVNARMTSAHVRKFCALDSDAEGMLRMAMENLQLSARAHDRILKVSRTIADLAGSESVAAEHINEAIQYRTLDRKLWA
jgi:magnesium chelatase family protein